MLKICCFNFDVLNFLFRRSHLNVAKLRKFGDLQIFQSVASYNTKIRDKRATTNDILDNLFVHTNIPKQQLLHGIKFHGTPSTWLL